MVRIRLRRIGLKGQPSYRIVIADKEAPRDGRFIEIVGFYNPRTQPATMDIDEAKVFDWMGKGAQPTESVAQIFKTSGTLDRFARLKKGEALETLVAEAAEAHTKRGAGVKTSGN
jgi:small subunit ribosomal protein S16